MSEKLAELFKTKPTKYELLDENRVVVHFGEVSVKAKIEEKGCCVGQYFKWGLDCEVSENGGKDYTKYRNYPMIESLKFNKEIVLKELVKSGCEI